MSVRGLTIQQPWAHLIVTGRKLVENRSKRATYRGPILIHAGAGRTWIKPTARTQFPDYAFGAVVGVANMVNCVSLELLGNGTRRVGPEALRSHPWIVEHQYAEGPWCYVLEDVQRLATPVPCRGQLGWWHPPAEVLAAIEQQGVTL